MFQECLGCFSSVHQKRPAGACRKQVRTGPRAPVLDNSDAPSSCRRGPRSAPHRASARGTEPRWWPPPGRWTAPARSRRWCAHPSPGPGLALLSLRDGVRAGPSRPRRLIIGAARFEVGLWCPMSTKNVSCSINWKNRLPAQTAETLVFRKSN